MSTADLSAPIDRQQRIRVIAECAAQPGRGHPVMFRGRYREFPVLAVPHRALAYRVDNGRLAAELEEWSAAPDRSLESLGAGADTAEVQALLHRLLLAKARDPEGPIFAELERLGQQTEPLLATFDGVVVNGNRRLAAMRELLGRDPVRYPFGEPAVAVLPRDIDAEDIEYIEAALQMAPETKLQYGWIDRRLKLRQQREKLRLPVPEIMAAYRIEDAAAIDREIGELSLAERYLRDYRGEPRRYSTVAGLGELFEGLYEQLGGLDADDAAFWRDVGFVMIDAESGLSPPTRQARARARLSGPHPYRRFFPFADPLPNDLASAALEPLAERFGIPVGAKAGVRAEAEARSALRAIFRQRDRSRRTADLIADVLDEMRLEHKEQSAPERMLKKVREAGQLIARLEPERLSEEQRRQLRGDLGALHSHAAYLLGDGVGKPPTPPRWRQAGAIVRPPYARIPVRLLRRLGWIAPRRAASR